MANSGNQNPNKANHLIARLEKLKREVDDAEKINQQATTPPPQPPKKATVLGSFEVKKPQTFNELLLWVGVGIVIGWSSNWIYWKFQSTLYYLSYAMTGLVPLLVIGLLVFFVLRSRK